MSRGICWASERVPACLGGTTQQETDEKEEKAQDLSLKAICC